jgi:hypothetical protein
MALGTGAALFFIHNILASKVDLVKNHPIATPLALGVGGHILKKKMPTVGTALLGAAGYAGAMAFTVTRANPPASAPTQTSALVEAAALLESNQVGDYVIPDAGDFDYDSGIGPNTGDIDVSEAMNLEV